MRFLHVVGARPNFMKVAPVMSALSVYPEAAQTLVHTGQHYDAGMSDIFFTQLGIPSPDFNLGVGSASHAEQTASIMTRLEPVICRESPNWVIVYGDVNSTLAAAIVCSKLGVPLAHVEAGLRSFDRSMPEEINRLVTDQLSSLLFTPSKDADANLRREGIGCEKIHCVGNVMIDTLVRLLPAADQKWDDASLREIVGDRQDAQGRWRFGLVTLHRPSNVDNIDSLSRLMLALARISRTLPLVFPVHPRTREKIQSLPFSLDDSELRLCDPVGYLEFLALQRRATVVITDSGGIQEETTFLGVPCLTLRTTTERPVTVNLGTNLVLGDDTERLQTEVAAIVGGQPKTGCVPILWDGKASVRVAKVLFQAS